MNGDDGATVVLLAVVMAVLLGFGAIAVDVGSLYAERRQLQNGADAAVLAVAPECAAGACDSGTGVGSTAGRYADLNANDDATTVTEICGTGPGLAPCSPVSGIGPWDCRPLPGGALASAPYAQVRTQTRRTDGSDLMPPLFARILDASYDGTTVRACARASWGAPAGLRSQLPITISLCEFQQYTSAGFSPPPPYPSGYSEERTLYFHNNTDDAPPCPAGPSGADLPGGFGWLDTSEDCVATTDTTNWVEAQTGVPVPSDCTDEGELAAMQGQIIDVPVFDNTNGLTGANGEYHIVGYAAFYLTGYVFPAQRTKSLLTNAFPCSGPDHCISGVFTQDLSATAGTIGAGPSMGVTVFQMSG